MDAQVLEINPYESFKKLYESASNLSNGKIRLFFDGEELMESNDSIIKCLHDKAIVHVVPIQ